MRHCKSFCIIIYIEMGISMKKVLLLLFVGILIISVFSVDANAAKKSGKGKGLSATAVQEMSDEVDRLTMKMYSRSLFSPEDNAKLIDVKIKLDNQILTSPDPTIAPLYYKAGVLYKSRDMRAEAIDWFQTILENFKDTALAPKAKAQLLYMG